MRPSEVQFAKNLEALKSPQCRRIVSVLSIEPKTLPELARRCKLTPGSIDKHLEILESAGLIHMSHADSLAKASLQEAALRETRDWFLSLGK